MLALTVNGTTEYIGDDQDQVDDAMRRYWAAKQAGDATAHLERVPDLPAVPQATPAGTVSETAVDRIRTHERWLDEAGFHLPPPIYAPGTRVVELGDDNFRLERQRVEDLPSFPDAAGKVIDAVRSERREDIPLVLGDLAMTPGGQLLADGELVHLESRAFHQLATLCGFGNGGRYLADQCEPEVRAANVNYQLQRSGRDRVVLRSRVDGVGQRTVYAAVTPSYTAVDVDQVLDVVSPALADAHTEMVYDGSGVRATALWMPDEVVDLAAGDVFKVGVRVETDDTGRGRIRIAGVAFRNLCLNLIIIGEGEVETVAQVHRGRTSDILESLESGVGAARDKVGRFLEAWGHARQVEVDVEETLTRWVDERVLKIPQTRTLEKRQEVIDAMLSAWRVEPGNNTLADAVNAVTRTAHSFSDWDFRTRDELERQAASLVMVPR